MLHLSEESGEVYYLKDIKSSQSDIHEFLLIKSVLSERSRCRLCLHNNPSSELQEMIICHLNNCDVPIHAHLTKGETFKVEKGILKYNIFDEEGNLLRENNIDSNSEKIFVPKGTFHNFEILSPFAIFREWTSGPFSKNDTKTISK